MPASNTLFYGWILVAVLWVCYGFGISPAYYSWGIFANSVIEEFDLNRKQVGLIFTVFVLMYNSISPVCGIAIGRWGSRGVMVVGSLLCAAGCFWLSRATSYWQMIPSFGILCGAGVGLASILPCQTLGSFWFIRYRARAIAIIFTAGGAVGKLIASIDRWMLDNADWRTGWLLIAGMSLALAAITGLFVRNRPEEMGLHPDGDEPGTVDPTRANSDGENKSNSIPAPSWTAAQAIRTPQFFLIVAGSAAYAVPWGVLVSHGPVHLGDLGLDPGPAASLIGTMALVSVLGRFTGGLGDFVPPQLLLAAALALQCVGVAGLVFADTFALARGCVILVGFGFGAAYICIPVLFSKFFGREAFATTSGTRLLIVGLFNAAGPLVAGAIADATGSYRNAFMLLIAMLVIGVVCALAAKSPGDPPTSGALSGAAAPAA